MRKLNLLEKTGIVALSVPVAAVTAVAALLAIGTIIDLLDNHEARRPFLR